jgi:hypothetical protein
MPKQKQKQPRKQPSPLKKPKKKLFWKRNVRLSLLNPSKPRVAMTRKQLRRVLV